MLGSPTPARADNPLNSSERGDPGVKRPVAGHDDFTLVPVAGGSTDIGFGGGFFAGVTRNEAGYLPYEWDLQSAGFVTFAPSPGGIELPYTDIYALATLTRFLGKPLQLQIRPSFTDEQALDYYGMGNASTATVPSGQSSRYFEYGRVHPELLVDLHLRVLDHVAVRTGLRYIETWYDIPPDSKLAADLRSGSAEVKSLIGPVEPQGAALFRYGAQLDDRDNEVSPHKGTFDEVAFNLAPGGTTEIPHAYGELSANLRGYVPLGPRVTLAGRIVGDLLFGDPPFFELSRAVDTYAIGGSNGIRGVPAQRYMGKVKLFGNVEARVKLFPFSVFGKKLALGVAGFFDGGRLWADTTPNPALDGSGIGLKYGIGGGLRLLAGSAFVLRGDIAWSPDASPIGGYLVAGESF